VPQREEEEGEEEAQQVTTLPSFFVARLPWI
jgi:hypothetical protein